MICDVHTRGAYYAVAERLCERDLTEALDEPVTCRWRHRATGLAIDIMPVAGDVLGFTNRWYALGIETAVERTLGSGAVIRAVAPAVVVATKLAAWLGRGRGDLAEELAGQPAELRDYVATELEALRALPYFDYAIQDVVRGYGSAAMDRVAVVLDRAAAIVARLSTTP